MEIPVFNQYYDEADQILFDIRHNNKTLLKHFLRAGVKHFFQII
jgi:hypothetical protein